MKTICPNILKCYHTFNHGLCPSWLPESPSEYNALHYLHKLGNASLASVKNLIRTHLYGYV